MHNHRQAKGGVGACKSTQCRYNDDFACSAESIRVSEHENGAIAAPAGMTMREAALRPALP